MVEFESMLLGFIAAGSPAAGMKTAGAIDAHLCTFARNG